MRKEMGSDWEPWPTLQKKKNSILLKLLVSALVIGLSFRLFFARSPPFSPISEPPTVAAVFDPHKDKPAAEKSNATDTVIPQIPVDVDGHDPKKESCDLFSGEWIRNPSGPAYTNRSCPFIEAQQNCMKNGRRDTEYQYWRWKPHGCDVPPFDAEKFLEAMRDKTWAFIGDSILRNHGQSMVCLLSTAELGVEIYHDEDYKSRTFHFPTHNFTLAVVWSPFLAKADIFENDEGVSRSEIQLHLNTLNTKWTKDYHKYDYVLMSVGQWFLKTAVYWENDQVVGCHYCPRLNLTERGLDYAYHKVLQSVFRFMTRSSHKPIVFYRTWTPDHFEYGEWSTGGICNRTLPYKKGEYEGKDVDHLMHEIELKEFRKVAAERMEDRIRLKLLNTYNLSLLRPDGHPGAYRNFHPFGEDKNTKVQNDCLHWCLPGPIDSWNELLMKMVVKD